MQRIILYYKFVPLTDPEAVRLWQLALAEGLNLRGRIIIAEHGINGTLGGDMKDLKRYIKLTRTHSAFKGMVFKWSDGKRADFPKLNVRVRPEIVTFGVPHKIRVSSQGVIGGGARLKPEQLHQLIDKKGKENVIFFDGRNAYEAAIGKFKGAVVGSVDHTRDFVKEIKKPKYTNLKDKTVVTYCTGGVRCEVLSMLMKEEGFRDVYQLDGGIVKYGEAFGNEGLWEGSLYVFDQRISVPLGPQVKAIGRCSHCQKPAGSFGDCRNTDCNRLFIACEVCAGKQYCADCSLLKATT